MSSFEYPSYLYLLWVPVALAVAGLLRRALSQKKAWSAGEARGYQLTRTSRWLSQLRLMLRTLAFGGIILALASPRPANFRNQPPAGQGLPRLVFVVDVSRSMLATDILPDRLTQARRVVAETVRKLNGEEVSIVAFAGNAQLYTPLTTDYEAVGRACLALSPSLIVHQGTSLADALSLAGQVLVDSRGQPRMLCLLSDGESHSAGYAVLADSLRRTGVELFVIGIGTPAGSFIPVSSPDGLPSGIKTTRNGQPIRSLLHEEQLLSLVQGRSDHYTRLSSWSSTVPVLLKKIRDQRPQPALAAGAGRLTGYQLCLLASFILLLLELLLPTGFSDQRL